MPLWFLDLDDPILFYYYLLEHFIIVQIKLPGLPIQEKGPTTLSLKIS